MLRWACKVKLFLISKLQPLILEIIIIILLMVGQTYTSEEEKDAGKPVEAIGYRFIYVLNTSPN